MNIVTNLVVCITAAGATAITVMSLVVDTTPEVASAEAMTRAHIDREETMVPTCMKAAHVLDGHQDAARALRQCLVRRYGELRAWVVGHHRAAAGLLVQVVLNVQTVPVQDGN